MSCYALIPSDYLYEVVRTLPKDEKPGVIELPTESFIVWFLKGPGFTDPQGQEHQAILRNIPFKRVEDLSESKLKKMCSDSKDYYNAKPENKDNQIPDEMILCQKGGTDKLGTGAGGELMVTELLGDN